MTSSAMSGDPTVSDGDFAALVFPTLSGRTDPHGGGDERARLEERWRARGHAAGYTEGLRAAAVTAAVQAARLDAEHAALLRTLAQDHERAVTVLRRAAQALDQRTVPVLRDAEDTLLGAAIDLAEAIIGHALADESAAVRFALARSGDSAVAGSSSAAPHTVRLHPHDLALLEQTPTLQTGVTLVADATLARGDAVSEFPDGYLDARIGSALERARAALGEVAS
ncbi:FliH/SctL family protein [Cryobacterium sp. SO2]|uniref:FliH/SctL family protein n=1 Tax=Cryobacterium sp. SO2 TaxID=1897060 RepID=UPI00223CDD39|nr:FliH/SctL family protein [Cryobacterium sp. SO2]WEO78974.1 FliH/SctL family protein [Cryobacterium sp. SO2]